MKDIYSKIAELVDTETVQDTDILADFDEWDSIAVISLIAFIDKTYKVQLYTDDIRATKTVGDLIARVQAKLNP